jgi:cytochrome c oxidase assembly protein subunit 11
MNSTDHHDRPHTRRDLAIAAACGVFVAFMVGAAYAAVPFYSWFCRVTGFAGTTQVATAAPTTVLDRRITVRFDGNVMGGLPWRFEPEQTSVEVKIGEVVTIMYRATNESARETLGQAAYNVTPLTMGSYFQKINCFCFTEQRLKAGETREMPVVFYVDPSIARDADGDKVDTITLSYSFYPVREPEKPAVSGATGRATRAADGAGPTGGVSPAAGTAAAGRI